MWRWRLGAAVLVMSLCGCSAVFPDQHQSDEDLSRNKGIAADLNDQWKGMPGVSSLSARYVDDADNNNQMRVDARCQDCDTEKLADQLVGDIWASQLSPLSNISVQVYDETADKSTLRAFTMSSDEHELHEKYGARPEGTTSK